MNGRGRLSAALIAVAVWGAQRPAGAQDELPPPGFGTLRQDEVAVLLSTENLRIRVLPLDERIIRLLSPDTYRSLSELLHSRGAALSPDSATAFVVTFFGIQPQVRFSPDELYVTSQNVFFRPIRIIPLSPRWSEYQLDQRQQATAIYLFQPGIVLLQPFTVSYGSLTSGAWDRSLRLLERERARVLARAQQGAAPPP